MRTAFLAGAAELIRAFPLYRSEHGCVMGLPVQAASVAAWGDTAHVAENHRLMENAVCAARSASKAWTQMPAPRPISSTCFGAIDSFPAYPA
jgi:aspartate/methionine/tyrosine aminotransferase